MALEDFTTYTEVDPLGRLTVTTNEVAGILIARNFEVYLYKDFGEAHFNALDIDFEWEIISSSDKDGTAGIAVSNVLDDVTGFGVTDIAAWITRFDPGGDYYIVLKRGSVAADDAYQISADTRYYCTLERAASSDDVSLKIYSDEARMNLLDTLMVSGYGTTTKYRYIFGFNNYDTGVAYTHWDGWIWNMDLHEVVPPEVYGYASIF